MPKHRTSKRFHRATHAPRRRAALAPPPGRPRARTPHVPAPSLPGERWRIIPAFPDYEASTAGRIRRANDAAGTREGRLLKPRIVRGYLRVDLRRRGASFNKSVAALVAQTWKGRCPRAQLVTHRDGDRHNNVVTNLAYATRSASVKARMPELNSQAKLAPAQVRVLRRLYKRGMSGADLARKYDISISAALSAAQGKTWTGVA